MRNEWDNLATPMDSCREYALNAGRERTESAWILTDFDVWMPNPFYQGPPVQHPEDWCDDEVPQPPAPPPMATVIEVDDDLPF
jgi:hypothetical protein